MSRAAELLDVPVYELYRLPERHGVELGATDAQREQSRALASRLGQPAAGQ